MAVRTVLITGCSTGFGKLAAKTFQAQGWNVVATMRDPAKGRELGELEGVVVTPLDVTDEASIQGAVDDTLDRFGAIDVLVNNAGVGAHALFEQFPDADLRRLYDTNVFGVMSVCRAVLPSMRRRRSGIVINVTSMAGLIGLAAETAYSSSKWAVQGFTEGLDLEYRLFGVRAKTVAPGAYLTTDFMANVDYRFAKSGDEELIAHSQRLQDHFASAVESEGGHRADAQEVADMIYTCATTDTPVHNPCGNDAKLILRMAGGPPRQEFLDNVQPLLAPLK